MDRTTSEVAALEEAVKDAAERALRELNELQLAVSGAGAADPIFF